MRGTFILAITMGAALLFFVQPLIGRLLLPGLGGVPMVWNTCMVFFQVVLLGGYVYAHVLSTRLRPLQQLVVHAAVLGCALFALPIGIEAAGAPPADVGPAWLLRTLGLAVGLPFFAVSTGAPLLQRWFSLTGRPDARDPYFLYAASNAGSLGALLAYPILVEPMIGLTTQCSLWTGGFVLYALVALAAGWLVVRQAPEAPVSGATSAPPADEPSAGGAPGLGRGLWWALLAFAPSSLMLGATQQITTDVASVPMFWVVPLALYLSTFVLAFAARPRSRPGFAGIVTVVLALVVLSSLAVWSGIGVAVALPTNLALLFFGALMCHRRLAASRPDPRFLTSFYLWLAIGGAAGGVFNALAAPLLFSDIVEYPLVIVLIALLRPRYRANVRRSIPRRWANYLADIVVVVLALVSIGLQHVPAISHAAGLEGQALLKRRTFFGVHHVSTDDDGRLVIYQNGTTVHGLQDRRDPRSPQAYYHPATGIGRALRDLAGSPRLARVGVIGLGAGSLAAFASSTSHWTFYEIDTAVVEIAEDPGLFTFLSDARAAGATVDVVVGDGRLSLEREPQGSFGLLVLDAFASDSIPIHLLTREALALYVSRLRPDGLLLLNVSSRHVDLLTVTGALARDLGLVALHVKTSSPGRRQPDAPESRHLYAADWVVLGRSSQALAFLTEEDVWKPLEAADVPVWTDDFSNLLGALRWRR